MAVAAFWLAESIDHRSSEAPQSSKSRNLFGHDACFMSVQEGALAGFPWPVGKSSISVPPGVSAPHSWMTHPGFGWGSGPGASGSARPRAPNGVLVVWPAWTGQSHRSGARPGLVPGISLRHPLSGPIGFLHGDEVAGVPPVDVEAVGEEGH